jgi:hypothetical protein
MLRASGRARHALAATLMTLAACANPRGSADAPAIDSVEPDSVRVELGAVMEVVIHGRGFAPGPEGRNVVHFGRVAVAQVPATADGTSIRFMIPTTIPTGSEAAPRPLEPGSYALRVETPGGTSNSTTVRILP